MANEDDKGQRRDIERRMILENQRVIMNALIALLGTTHAASSDLFYHTSKTMAYLGGRAR